tara:strand:+ start:291 stop:599 length:309 start_codon:yes stop_codon:yes gene_type:complete
MIKRLLQKKIKNFPNLLVNKKTEDAMLEFIEQAIKLLVDKPDEVNIEIVETEQRLIYELTVGEGDYGKVIGKGGRNISALRTLVFAINAKEGGKRARLDVVD